MDGAGILSPEIFRSARGLVAHQPVHQSQWPDLALPNLPTTSSTPPAPALHKADLLDVAAFRFIPVAGGKSAGHLHILPSKAPTIAGCVVLDGSRPADRHTVGKGGSVVWNEGLHPSIPLDSRPRPPGRGSVVWNEGLHSAVSWEVEPAASADEGLHEERGDAG